MISKEGSNELYLDFYNNCMIFANMHRLYDDTKWKDYIYVSFYHICLDISTFVVLEPTHPADSLQNSLLCLQLDSAAFAFSLVGHQHVECIAFWI